MVETMGIEFSIRVRRGNFQLEAAGLFASRWTVLFGPSGAGKTTLLRHLAGLDLPQKKSGENLMVSLHSKPLTDFARKIAVKPGGRQTAFVTQQPALFPHLDVSSNVAYGLYTLPAATQKARVDESLALVGASDLAARRPRDLSGGEAQRVALARALATQPRLLLLDEPFSALDGAATDELLVRLRPWLAERHVQVVLATHDVSDALFLDAVVANMRAGQIVAQGPAPQVLAQERQRLLDRLS